MPRLKKKKAKKLTAGTSQAIDSAYEQAIQHHEQNNLEGAEPIYRKILELNPRHDGATYYLGVLLLKKQQYEEALPFLKQALPGISDSFEAHTNVGLALHYCNRQDEAEKYLKKALSLNPELAEAYDALGAVKVKKNEYGEAEKYFLKAIEADPEFAQSYYNYAAILERQSKLDKAQETVARALEIFPDDFKINLMAARLLKRQECYEESLAILTGIEPDDPDIRATYHTELGQLYDRLNQPAEAFSAFSKANRLQTGPALHLNKNTYPNRIKTYKAVTTPDWYRSWKESPEENNEETPVFLIGFPRSGTTLLDQILTAQGSFSVAEECDALQNIREKITARHKNYPSCLAGLSSQEIIALRSRYRGGLKKLGRLESGKQPVDKLPLHTIDVALIHRIFPNAKIIFALRHPCDCVLSCFMQQFKLNTAMIHFLDLENAADFYAQTMDLWRIYEETLPLKTHIVRYENVITDFRSEIETLLTFLEVPWNDDVLEFNKTAKERKLINTPSYAQVTEKIYTRASGRWQRYHEQMSPVLSILEPFVNDFGYRTE